LFSGRSEEARVTAGRGRGDGFGEERKRLFLAALRQGHGVLAACALVGISNRTAYNHRAADPAFARDWAVARRASTLPLELVAFERAVDGVEEPVYSYGRLSHVRVRRSDALLARLLVAEQPEKFGSAAAIAAAKILKRLVRRLDALERRLDEANMRSVRSSGAVNIVNRDVGRRASRASGGWRLARARRRAGAPEISRGGGES
jgi:hypothetical protein